MHQYIYILERTLLLVNSRSTSIRLFLPFKVGELLVIYNQYYSSRLSKNNKTFLCGAEGIRTLDPLVANQVLSQLSYSPVTQVKNTHTFVGLSGVEPLTSRLSGVRSNHLSYRPSVDDDSSKKIK